MKRPYRWLLGVLILLATVAGFYGRFLYESQLPRPSRSYGFYGPSAPYVVVTSYTKLDDRGGPLPDSALKWTTVRDNITGLIWEVKTNMDGIHNYADPHDADNRYTWYNSNPHANGGRAGSESGERDTESFLAILNTNRYGGYSDWRLPTMSELFSLVRRDRALPSIDRHYFPATKTSQYWSAVSADIAYGAWGVDFSRGFESSFYKGYYFHTLAVRGGRPSSITTKVWR